MPAAVAQSSVADKRVLAWGMIPLALLVAAGLLANFGIGYTQNAHAASANVGVNATVPSVVTLTPCGATLSVTVVMGGMSTGGTCAVTFGASNNAALPMTIADNAGAAEFLSGAFTETGAGCGAMGTDKVGYKVDSAATATVNSACVKGALSTNTNYMPLPNSASTVCTTSSTGNQTCPINIGINEVGSDATAGVYTGQFNLAA